ncbi:hypothetical protein K502DRAFT_351031 [Neoconidiobolus thromboides FSU 785]|nr:hypothetical protein K502DRAFT_351031 [Neoconidiobolus thromboides FSU 785]
MKLSYALTVLISMLLMSSSVFAQEDSVGGDNEMPKNGSMVINGAEFASFETPGEIGKKSERTIIPIILLLNHIFKQHQPPKPQCPTTNCCYGVDSNGCCIGGSGNCNPCPGPNCPWPCPPGNPNCFQCPPGWTGCRNPCPGPYCPYQCPGPNCPYICPGPYCGNVCPGPNCPIRCPGPNCPVACPGPYCPQPCFGPYCGSVICPPQICNINYPYRPIIFNININQNIIINGDQPNYVCIRVPNQFGGYYRVCGPRDNLKCYLTPENQYQVRIMDPTDNRISISQ